MTNCGFCNRPLGNRTPIETKKIGLLVCSQECRVKIEIRMKEMVIGFNDLTPDQQERFTGILEKFMNAQGTDTRNNLIVKSVKVTSEGFRIDITRSGVPGHQILNSNTVEWW